MIKLRSSGCPGFDKAMKAGEVLIDEMIPLYELTRGLSGVWQDRGGGKFNVNTVVVPPATLEVHCDRDSGRNRLIATFDFDEDSGYYRFSYKNLTKKTPSSSGIHAFFDCARDEMFGRATKVGERGAVNSSADSDWKKGTFTIDYKTTTSLDLTGRLPPDDNWANGYSERWEVTCFYGYVGAKEVGYCGNSTRLFESFAGDKKVIARQNKKYIAELAKAIRKGEVTFSVHRRSFLSIPYDTRDRLESIARAVE